MWPLLPQAAEAATISKPGNYLTINTGLVRWYTFDGSDMYWSSNTITDRAGVDGATMYNMSTSSSPAIGQFGQALKFDGVNDYIDAGQVNFGTESFSVSVWVDQDDGTSVRSGYLSQNAYYGLGVGWKLGTLFSGVEFVIDSGATSVGSFHTPPEGIDGPPLHVVGVVDRGTGYLRLYVGGVQVDQDDISAVGNIFANEALLIGAGNSLPDHFFPGTIDDVRIYNRVLSAQEVAALYNTGRAKVGAKTNKSPGTLGSGLIGHWTFDGPDMTLNVRDRSGQGNNGFLLNMTTTTESGRIGQALQFDGVDDAVGVGHLTDGLSAMTISAWFKGRLANDSHLRIASESGSFDFRRYATESFYFQVNNGVTTGSVFSDTSFADTEWHHVVGVFDGSRVDLYVDGRDDEAADVPLTGPVGTSGGADVFMMGDMNSGSAPLDAVLDDVRLYNRALTAAEIQQLYKLGQDKVAATVVGSGNSGGGLVGHWTFDGKHTDWAAGTLADATGRGNTGYFLGAMATATVPVEGRIGQAFNFDGDDDYIAIADPGDGSLDFGTNSFSYSFWFNATAVRTCGWFDKKGGGLTTNAGYASGIGSTGSTFSIVNRLADGTNYLEYNPISGRVANRWYFYTVVTDRATNIQYSYLDGAFAGTQDISTIGSVSNPYSLLLGRRNAVSYCKGTMDDVRIFNKALSAQEVQMFYQMGR